MKVMCNENTGEELPELYKKLGYSNKSTFNLSINNSYNVYSIALYKGVLLYLLCDDSKYPNWYPEEIFTVIDNRVPSNWYFKSYDIDSDSLLQGIFGYDEIVNSETHYDLLIERDKEALNKFLKISSDYQD